MATWEGLTPPYRTIVVDPPWAYDEVDMPYSTMTLGEIVALPVVDLAERGSRLFLWTTNRYLWEWPRSSHSSKPPAFLDVVESVSPGPYVELFARAPRLGWDSWGKGYEVAS